MAWTKEMRERQRQRILQNKPWLKSTGPTSDAGKKISSQNALKHGKRSKAAKETKQLLIFHKRLSRLTNIELENNVHDLFKRNNSWFMQNE